MWIVFAFIWKCKSVKIVTVRLVGVPHPKGRAFSATVVEASSPGVNIYHRKPSNSMVVCIPQMLVNLYKIFTSDEWAYMSLFEPKWV